MIQPKFLTNLKSLLIGYFLEAIIEFCAKIANTIYDLTGLSLSWFKCLLSCFCLHNDNEIHASTSTLTTPLQSLRTKDEAYI